MTTRPDTLDAALIRFRSIFGELAKGAGERDLSGEHPYELVRELADAGFGKLRVPREYGGFDVDLPTDQERDKDIPRRISGIMSYITTF